VPHHLCITPGCRRARRNLWSTHCDDHHERILLGCRVCGSLAHVACGRPEPEPLSELELRWQHGDR
jgi:hypothetical protein